MEYTVHELALISGVSVRTLHYYDKIGLLRPLRIEQNGYRKYGTEQVDKLQQILFYKELGVSLKKIKSILQNENFDREKELEEQLTALLQKKEELELLIENVKRTISSVKGEETMSDKEKFDGLKKQMVEENEEKYGKEIREKYGDEAIDASNAKLMNMSQSQWESTQKLGEEINTKLQKAFQEGNPASELAQEVCDLHRQWLCLYWTEGTYSKEAHKALAEGYVSDERFTAYYDKLGEGCTKFFRDAIVIYCS